MGSTAVTKILVYRAGWAAILLAGIGAVAIAVLLSSRPTYAVSSAVVGGLLGLLILPAFQGRGRKNLQRYRSHLGDVDTKRFVLMGGGPRGAGVWLADWGNSRWRDLAEDGSESTYARSPLLLSAQTPGGRIQNTYRLNTGVPINDIAGMDDALFHLAAAEAAAVRERVISRQGFHPSNLLRTIHAVANVDELDLPSLVCPDLAGELQEARREWDVNFASSLRQAAVAQLPAEGCSLVVGWEDSPYLLPPQGTWRLGANAFESMASESPPATTEGPRLVPAGGGYPPWRVMLGSASSFWFLTGTGALPETELVEGIVSRLILALREHGPPQTRKREVMDLERSLQSALTDWKTKLAEAEPAKGWCPACESLWMIAPDD